MQVLMVAPQRRVVDVFRRDAGVARLSIKPTSDASILAGDQERLLDYVTRPMARR
jgi:hypothetical protein